MFRFGLTTFSALVMLTVAACGTGSAPTATTGPSATQAVPTAVSTAVQGAPTATPAPTRPSATVTAAPTATQAPRTGGTLRWAPLGTSNRGDPHASFGVGDSWSVTGNSTLRLKPHDLSVYGDLAESWEYKTPTELVIKYKRGVHFQQESLAKGRELTADDVVASLTRALTKTPPLGSGVGFPLTSKYAALDQYTVRVTFTAPDANYLFTIALPTVGVILPKEVVDKYPDKLMGEDGYFATGPFVFDATAYRPDSSGAYNKNPKYDVRLGQPYLDRVEWVYIVDASSRTAALRTGQVDIGIVPALEKDAFAKNGYRLTSTEDNTISTQHLALNTQLYPTSDVRVRRAINMIIDRQELKLVVADGFGCTIIILGCKSDWLLTEKDFTGKAGFRDKATDIAEAKTLLKDAGVDPATTTLILGSGQQQVYKVHFEQAVAIVGMLQRSLGFKVTHIQQNQPNPNRTPDQVKKDGIHVSNIAMGGLGNFALDWALQVALTKDAPYNASLWYDSKTQALYEAQRSAVDPKERKKLFQEIQTYLMQDTTLPVAPTVRDYVYYGTTSRVHDWDGTGVYFTGIYAWQLAWTWVDK